jgi:hypothetical protein
MILSISVWSLACQKQNIVPWLEDYHGYRYIAGKEIVQDLTGKISDLIFWVYLERLGL